MSNMLDALIAIYAYRRISGHCAAVLNRKSRIKIYLMKQIFDLILREIFSIIQLDQESKKDKRSDKILHRI